MASTPTEPSPAAADADPARGLVHPSPAAGDAAPPAAPVLSYAAGPRSGRGAWRGRVWPWVRPGSVGFIVILASAAAGLWWGVWTWRVAEDRKAFAACTTISNGGGGAVGVQFTHAPTRSALRHLSRLPGPFHVVMDWPAAEDPGAAEVFHSADLGNVTGIRINDPVNADLLLKELTRPDCGLKALKWLDLDRTKVTAAGLKELSRPDCGLKALSMLNLWGTQVTDAGLKELSRPDCGLKALTVLDLSNTPVTDAGVKELKSARPGLTIYR